MSHTDTQQHPVPVDPAHGAKLITEALGAAPLMARLEARQEALAALTSPRLDEHVQDLMDTRYTWRYRPRLLLTFFLLMTSFFVMFYFIIMNQVNFNAELNAQDAEIVSLQHSLEASNVKLQAQGLPPVTAPVDPQPGSPEQATLITAAATASTLASLPPTVLKDPQAVDVGKAVADYISQHSADIYGPMSQELIKNIAQYLAVNKETVAVNVPPTAADITKAFTAALASNPQLLCPAGGTYGSRQVALVGGGSVATYGCYGDTTPAPPVVNPPAPDPTPTTTPDAPANTTPSAG